MMITAKQANIRQAPRKMRLVVSQVKKLGLEGAISQLAVIERRSSLAILKVIKTALASALNDYKLNVEDLTLKDIIVTDGPILKRMRAVSRGRGFGINKRTCHVQVILESKDPKELATPIENTTEENKKVEKTKKGI
jgi:large subunit ribosomal protein L22